MTSAVQAPGINQRRGIRVAPDARANVTVHINGPDFIEIQKAVDIGEGGVRLRVPHRFEGCHIDNLVTLVISLPLSDTPPFRLEGRIRHAGNDTFGVQFASVGENARQLLRRYIALRLRESEGLLAYLKFRLGLVR
ncbi:MAG TPA: PilZ domain-containing protein [Moraxellaceae bacterium]|nr:PilZ domain-containing protein [Moraxellaceae bacterium]